MSLVDELSLGTSVDLSGYRSGFADASRMVDDFVAGSTRKMEGVKPRGLGVDPGDLVGGLGDAVAPLGQQIQQALVAAMAPLNGFAARFGAQFDVVGKVLVNSALKADRKLRFMNAQEAIGKVKGAIDRTFLGAGDSASKADQAIRFPKAQEAIARIKGAADRTFAEVEDVALKVDRKLRFMNAQEAITRVAKVASKTLGAISFGLNVKNFVGQMRSVLKGDGGLSKLGGLAPTLNFDNSIRQITTLRGATDRATQSFKSMGAQVALSLGFFSLTYKAVGFLKGGIASATDLNETLSKTDAILLDASPAVRSFADGLADEFGLIKGEVLDISSSLGGLGKGLGNLTGKGLSDFTTQFTQAAADISSFANIDLQQAGQALTIGLSGEQSDILKRLGVVTTEAAMAQYALANGIQKTGGSFTEQQKFAIRSGLILQKLGKDGVNALGDLERTAGGTANQQRRLAGSIQNLATDLGTALLPALDHGIKLGNELVSALRGAFEANRPAIDAFTQRIGYGIDLVGQVGTELIPEFLHIGSVIVDAFSSAGSAVLGFLPSFGSVVDGVRGGLITVGMFLESTFASLRNLFGGETAASLASFATMVGGGLVEAFDTLGFVVRNAGALIEIAFLKGSAWVDNFMANLGRVGDFAANNWLDIMLAPFEVINDTLKELSASVIAFLRDPTQGFDFDLNKAFRAPIKLAMKLPDAAPMADLTDQIDGIYQGIARTETEFARRKGPAFVMPEFKPAPGGGAAGAGAPAMAAPEDPAKEKAVKFAGAVELGSKDAYDAIIKGVLGGGSGPMDAMNKTGKEQLAVLKDIRAKFKVGPVGDGGIRPVIYNI